MALLHEIGFSLGGVLLTLLSFRLYYDGLERLSNLEAGLWAVAMLIAGFSAFVFDSLLLAGSALAILCLYALRSRRFADG